MSQDSPAAAGVTNPPKPLNRRQRRILGVLIEKARTTPDVYPMTVNGIVTGANQKSNRYPVMTLTPEQVEDELTEMRNAGIVAEVHGGGRVPKYRHFGYDYMGVKGVEAAVMAELLLRGAQTAGELRTRASRFEPIADLATLDGILKSLVERRLVVPLTPAGRGQVFTHNLYLPEELDSVRAEAASRVGDGESSAEPSTRSTASASLQQDVEALRAEVEQLRDALEQLNQRMAALES
jgi:uncharacterized protein